MHLSIDFRNFYAKARDFYVPECLYNFIKMLCKVIFISQLENFGMQILQLQLKAKPVLSKKTTYLSVKCVNKFYNLWYT